MDNSSDNSESLLSLLLCAIIIAIIEAIIILGRLLPPLSTTSLTLTFGLAAYVQSVSSPVLAPSAGQTKDGRQVGRSVIKMMPLNSGY